MAPLPSDGSVHQLGGWEDVKARAEPSDGKGAMLPYLLVYDIF